MNFSHSYFVLAFLAIIVMFVGSTSTVYAGVDPLKEEDPCFGMFDPTGCGIDDYLLKANMSLPENMKWCGESDKIGFPLLCDVKDPKKQLSFMLVPTNPENGPMEIGITSICDLEPLPYDEAEPLELIVCENPQLILAPISTDDFVSEATNDSSSEDPCFGMFDPTGCGIDDYLLKANMSLPENMKWCGESDKIGFPLLCDVKDPKKQLSFMLVPTNPENGPMEIGITSICDLEPLPYDEAEPLELIVCENPQLILAPISTDDFVSEATGSEDDVKPKSLKEQLANEKINLNMEKVSESERATQQSVLTNKILSPLKQISEGISASDVTCNEGLEKIFKNNDSPICVKSSTAEKLIQRNLAHR